MTPRVVAIIQARMGSSRLPGKVLLDIAGRPMLMRVVERARRAVLIAEAVVATSDEASDEPIVEACRQADVLCLRGHPLDVLDRVHAASEATQADVIVRLTADCPLLDPGVVDLTVRAFLDANPPVDLALNRLPWDRTYPIGLDTEVFSREALQRTWREAREPHQREHVVPYMYEIPGRFRVVHVRAEADFGDYRWTVDTPEDLQLVRAVYAAFAGREDFGWREVLALLRVKPELTAVNAHVRHKTHQDVG